MTSGEMQFSGKAWREAVLRAERNGYARGLAQGRREGAEEMRERAVNVAKGLDIDDGCGIGCDCQGAHVAGAECAAYDIEQKIRNLPTSPDEEQAGRGQ